CFFFYLYHPSYSVIFFLSLHDALPISSFACSTYSKRHMHEITDLVQEFNPEIVLSSTNLYDRFGLDNGAEILVEDKTISGLNSRSEEHTSELQSRFDLVCRLLLEKKNE